MSARWEWDKEKGHPVLRPVIRGVDGRPLAPPNPGIAAPRFVAFALGAGAVGLAGGLVTLIVALALELGPWAFAALAAAALFVWLSGFVGTVLLRWLEDE